MCSWLCEYLSLCEEEIATVIEQAAATVKLKIQISNPLATQSKQSLILFSKYWTFH